MTLDYSSNFKINMQNIQPQQLDNTIYQVSNTRKKLKPTGAANRVICKHSILMLMLFHKYNNLNYLRTESNFNITNLSFFFKPSKSKYFTLLRAPYRYKIARNQLVFKRFFFKCSVGLKLRTKQSRLPLNSSFGPLLTLDKTITNLYSDLDTNICTQDNLVLSLPFTYVNFFKIKNYS